MNPAVASDAAPLAVRIVLLVLLLLLGGALGSVGALGWRGRLRRAGRVGVRTAGALRDDDAFRLANRVAGPPALVAGVAAVLGGLAAFALPTTTGTVVAAVIGLLGALFFARAGAHLGDRAASALPVDNCAAGESAAGTLPQCAGCEGACAVLSRG